MSNNRTNQANNKNAVRPFVSKMPQSGNIFQKRVQTAPKDPPPSKFEIKSGREEETIAKLKEEHKKVLADANLAPPSQSLFDISLDITGQSTPSPL